MVKTRQSGGRNDDFSETFVTIQTRKTRRTTRLEAEPDGYASEDSGISHYPINVKRQRLQDNQHTGNEAEHHESHRRPSSLHLDSLRKEMPVSHRTTRNCRYRQDTSQSSADSSSKEHTSNGDIEHGSKVALLNNHLDKHVDSAAVGSNQPRRAKRIAVETLYDDPELMHLDMYTRVKRERRKVVRVREDRLTEEESSSEEEDRSSEDEEEMEEEGDEAQRPYFLRQHKPVTKRFEAPPIEPLRRRQTNIFQDGPSQPMEKNYRRRHSINHYRSPAHKSPLFKRKRHAAHQSSSTGSSDSSDDERRFERRKARSMAKARNRCLPLNLRAEDVSTGVLRDRMRAGASLADVDPMTLDSNITFDCVGGLGKYVQALKEMVVFPLLYPEVFDRFKISPPRGVLFHGPPGTGKTLVARALANECSLGDRRVAFFMRKGADCLSKWVGESERQLRLLFDQAYSMRPSIIFFDEIDGIAPVRSSRQDQIHSSIVSTLLALMDGLDNRGEIVIIGATNRLDSIDPALRRPGRFDREFFFPLPNKEARRSILRIHTREWNPKLCIAFMNEVADKCVGYCGADLKALCTEAALFALRRKYPQIYSSKKKLQLDVSSINVTAGDFQRAMFVIVPTAQRSVMSSGRVLSPTIRPLLQNLLNKITESIETIFPSALAQYRNVDNPGSSTENNVGVFEVFDDESQSEDEENALSIFESPPTREGRARKRLAMNDAVNSGPPSFLNSTSCLQKRPPTHKPKILLSGTHGQGQNSHLAPAVLHHLEGIPVHRLDLSTLFAVSFRTPEESCAQILNEAKRVSPSILYVPHIGQWWDALNDTIRATFLTLLDDMDPTMPILLMATSDVIFDHLPLQIQNLFKEGSGRIIQLVDPDEKERREFFEDLILNQASKLPSKPKPGGKKHLEPLPVAPPPEPRRLTESELKLIRGQEESTMRELRLFLRDILKKLAKDRRFSLFAKPVDCEEVPDYLEVIKTPMDLSTMMTKIDMHQYESVQQFLSDIDQVCSNALEYNPDKDPADKLIRHRACELRDTAQSMVESELDPDFEKLCLEIQEARKQRGETPRKTIPPFSFVLRNENVINNINITATAKVKTATTTCSIPNDYPTRYSRRLRGMDISTPPASETESNTVQIKDSMYSNSPIIRRQYKKKRPYNRRRIIDDDENGSQDDDDIDQERILKETIDKINKSEHKLNDFTFDKLDNKEFVNSFDSHGIAETYNTSNPNSREVFPSHIQKLEDHCKSPVSSGDADSRTSPLTEDSSSQHSHCVIVDRNHLLKLLDTLVRVTEGCNVEILERLHTSIRQYIYIHRKNLDRMALIRDMEKEIKEFSQHFAPR